MKDKLPLVSVVIPVYNTEKYLEKCVNSVLNQTYKNTEIILVDDGSRDESGKICDNFAKAYENISAYHTENRGQSHARNYGIKKSKGEYISFIDSDDYIAKDMIERLVNGCEKNSAEMGCINKVRVSPNGEEFKEEISAKKKVAKPDGALLLLLLLYDPSPCNKIYKKELFKDISFPIGVVYEDILTVPRLIDACEKIYFDDGYGYYYLQNEGSTIHSKFTKKKLNAFYASKWLYDFTLEKYPDLRVAAERFYILSLTTAITDIYPARKKFKKEYREIKQQLRLFRKKYKNNPYIPFTKKVMVFMDLHGMVQVVNLVKKIRHNGRFN